MRIPSQSTIIASERALLALAADFGDESLILPKNIKHLAGGAEAALTQAIVTWAQRSEARRLETYISTPDQVEEFVRRLPGLVAALCADEAVALGGDASLMPLLTSAALTRLKHLQGSRPKAGYRGSSAEIVCADHLGWDAPYLLYLPDHRGGSKLRSRENFRDLAYWLLIGAVPREYHGLFDAEAGEALGGMLFEIFKNTQDHALADIYGNVLDISIRAIKTNHHAITPEGMQRIVEEFEPLANYCDTLAPPEGGHQTHLFELSVLDSGPGFASTWTGLPIEELSLEQEETAVRECFGRGSAKGESRFGEGLPHVLRLLKRQQGFLRLRTGRLSLYADFSELGDADNAGLLRRYHAGDTPELAPVSGSLLTILIPMRR